MRYRTRSWSSTDGDCCGNYEEDGGRGHRPSKNFYLFPYGGKPALTKGPAKRAGMWAGRGEEDQEANSILHALDWPVGQSPEVSPFLLIPLLRRLLSWGWKLGGSISRGFRSMEVGTCCTTSTATSLRSAPSTSRHCARSAEGLTASYGERAPPHACKVATFPFRSASFLVSCLFDLFSKVQTCRSQRFE